VKESVCGTFSVTQLTDIIAKRQTARDKLTRGLRFIQPLSEVRETFEADAKRRQQQKYGDNRFRGSVCQHNDKPGNMGYSLNKVNVARVVSYSASELGS
jgi:hypothetical protein